MSHDVIEAVLKSDLTSWSAQYYYDNYNTDSRLTSSSQVPRYIYTCLCDLITGAVGASPTFDQLIVAEYGVTKTPASLGVIIQPTDVVEPALHFDFVSDDDLGAKKAYVNILVKNIFTSTDYYRVRDIGLRIQYILDSKLRGLANNQFMLVNSPGTLDPSVLVDNSISPDSYFKVQWEASSTPHAKEQSHRYCVVYNQYF
jgi:hypothetical protein